MLEELMKHYADFMAIGKDNPILASLLATIVGGGVMFWVRGVPSVIYNFIVKQLTTSMTFNNSGWNSNESQFLSFLGWYSTSSWFSFSRTMSLDSPGWKGKVVIGPGFGVHFFIRNGRLFWFTKTTLDSSGSEKEKMQITITVLGRSQQYLTDLVEEFRFKDRENEIFVETFNDGRWDNRVYIPKRKLSDIALNEITRSLIKDRVDWFVNNKSWYEERGLAYKLVFVLEGPPGTGKTSLIRAIATEYKRNIMSMSLPDMGDGSLVRAVMSAEKGSIIAMEDFDCITSLHDRGIEDNQPKSLPKRQQQDVETTLDPIATSSSTGSVRNVNEQYSFISLTTMLNVLDGLVPLDDQIVILTTNDIASIDPALTRAGRVNYVINVPLLTSKEIIYYIEKMFPGHEAPQLPYEDIAGCNLEKLFMENPHNADKFIESIPKRSFVETEEHLLVAVG